MGTQHRVGGFGGSRWGLAVFWAVWYCGPATGGLVIIVTATHTTGSDVHQSATITTLTKTSMVPSAAGEPSPAGGELALTLLHDAAAEMGAVCLDGSPPGYYFRKGVGEGARKFLLVFNGGGWCKGGTAEEVAEACASRAAGPLGSSTHWAQTLTPDLHGVDNPNCTVSVPLATTSLDTFASVPELGLTDRTSHCRAVSPDQPGVLHVVCRM